MSQKRFWPDPDQMLLLHLCLQKDPAAAKRTWVQWKRRVNLDDLDHASFRIMSLAYNRLVSLRIDDPDMGRIKGIYRYQWTKNKLAFRGKADLIRAFNQASIPTLLLKGAALCQSVYQDPTTRPMHDLDLLVPVADAPKVVRLLQERKWTAQHFDPDAIIANLHACSFLHPQFGELDLHWHVFRSHCSAERDAELWAAAVDHRFEGAPTKILCPADQFLHACEHGTHYSPSSSLQWLVDACFILRRSSTRMDWDRLLEQTGKFSLTLPVRHTLAFLAEQFDESIPGHVMRQLARSPVGWVGHLEYFLAGRKETTEQTFLHRSLTLLCHYVRAKQGRSAWDLALGFPDYVRLAHHYDGSLGGFLLDRLLAALVWTKLKLCDFLLCGICRLSGSPPLEKKDLAVLCKHGTTGLHAAESVLSQTFMWSKVEGSIQLQLPEKDCLLIWEFPECCRSRHVWRRHPVFRLNGRTLSAQKNPWTQPGVALGVAQKLIQPGALQTLSWSVEPFIPGGKDPRTLGLPVYRVWVFPQ
ncbi:MAG: nucleotidyltransferase family protein [Candidatus Methylacidiphilales bacterium]|nr:nucleotidyltransferase family protein [Candidatus Methylacidiphilales bacterium]